MATIQDIADKVGVSIASISLYLNDKDTNRVGKVTKKKIDDAIKVLGYRPNAIARSLSSKNSKTIGIIIPHQGELFRSIFVNEVLYGMQEVLFAKEYSFLFIPSKGIDSPSTLRYQLDHVGGYDGLIAFGTRYCSIDDLKMNIKELKRTGIPFVTVNMPELSGDINQIILSNPISNHPIKYLFENGHENILVVSGRRQSPDTMEALSHYKSLAKEYNISFNEKYFVYGDYEQENAKSVVLQTINDRLPFTAVWAMSDMMALGVYEALSEKSQLIPDQVSVVGTNDTYFARYMTPPLTTLRRRIKDSGRAAATELLELLGGRKKSRKIVLDSEMILRSSVRNLLLKNEKK